MDEAQALAAELRDLLTLQHANHKIAAELERQARDADKRLPFTEIIGLIKIRQHLGMPDAYNPHFPIDLTDHTNAYIVRLADSGATTLRTFYDTAGHRLIVSYLAERPIPFLAPTPSETPAPPEEWIVVQIVCVFCGKAHAIHVKAIDLAAYNVAHDSRPYIQHIFPYLSADERELLISHTCADCFPKEPLDNETEYADQPDAPDDGAIDPDDLPQDDDDPNALQNEQILVANELMRDELS